MANSAISQNMNKNEWLMLIFLSVLWGMSFFFSKIALAELSPLTITFARYGLAAVTLLPIIYFRGLRLPLNWAAWQIFIIMGVLNNAIPQTLIITSQQYISSGLASILNATTPLFAVIVAHIFTGDEKITWNKLLGVIIGFCGVAVLIGFQTLDLKDTSLFAIILGLMAALSYAFSGVYGRRIKALNLAGLTVAAGQTTASTLIMAVVILFFGNKIAFSPLAFSTWGALLGLGVLSTALAYIYFFRILNAAGATNIMLVTFLIPLSAIFLGVMLLGETIEPRHIIGMALIGFGLLAIDGRALKRFNLS
jgi:drug/metabolite transporter (DMT)-like permease